MEDFFECELRPTKPEDLPGGAPPLVTRRFIVEVTSRYSDTHSAVAARLQDEMPSEDWPWYGRVLSEDGSLVVAFPIMCMTGECDSDPDLDPRACDPIDSGCAAPKPTEPKFRVIEF
jgi:hypothetical protein